MEDSKTLSSLLERIEILEKKLSLNNEKLLGRVVDYLDSSKKELNKNISILQENIDNSSFKEIKNEVSRLKDRIKTFKLKREDLFKALSLDGEFTLTNLFILPPRILPKEAKQGTIIIDIKDGKLKYYYNGWKTLKTE